MKWPRVDLRTPVRVRTEFYDGAGRLVDSVEVESVPTQNPGYNWARHYFDTAKDREGLWTIKVYAQSKLVATGHIQVDRER